MSLRSRLLLLVTLATLVPAIFLAVRFFQARTAEIDTALAGLSLQANNIANDWTRKFRARLNSNLAWRVPLISIAPIKRSALLSSPRCLKSTRNIPES